ncbi:hypothetical protein BC834DRAFT_989217, partial [Gloeopeniophorella convolvens]
MITGGLGSHARSVSSPIWCFSCSYSVQHCLLDVVGAFPRAVLSEKQLDVARWLAIELGAPENLPAVNTVKNHRDSILSVAGSGVDASTSAFGRKYFVSSLASILAHEVANPYVRPHLRFYPEDAPREFSEGRHGDRWLHEVDANLCAPMARAPDGQDYFVNEPALANLGLDGDPVAPVWITRWFEREDKLYAKAHPLTVDHANNSLIIEATTTLEVPLSAFFLSLPKLAVVHAEYGLPPPDHISGESPCIPVAITLPNPWRLKANGRRVLAVPIWLYCDDTSGNTSKKWNQHDSFLFILAGLLQAYSLLPYNIHFLSTSNKASPLEMLEHIVSEIQKILQDGLIAWDCVFREEVMLVAWVLAAMGDNPMQSEFASHIGLRGRHFCRICMICGKDRSKNQPVDLPGRDIAYTMAFLQVGQPQSRAQILTTLRTQHSHVLNMQATQATVLATSTGIKDKHLTQFHDHLADIVSATKDHNRLQGQPVSHGVKDAIARAFPEVAFEDMINPILSLDHLDVTRDTPVEVLHVILLGVVKYFWRDTIARLDSRGKATLVARLSSLDLSDLGRSNVQGHPYVQNAGSLTGGDFRLILETAPIVLYDLVAGPAWVAWLAICRAGPLLLQLRIQSCAIYLDHLRTVIDDFIVATALWNPRWFNKPKFHILLHLPDHIQRLAPPAIIVHSNRQAPSKDIAFAMSFTHATRHLVSGGFVQDPTAPNGPPRQAGDGVLALASKDTFSQHIGLKSLHSLTQCLIGSNKCVPKANCMSWNETTTASMNVQPLPAAATSAGSVYQYHTLGLYNGDAASLQGFVFFQSELPRQLGQVMEIVGDRARVFGALLKLWKVLPTVQPYRMPAITPAVPARYVFVSQEVSLETSHLNPDRQHMICCVHTFHNCASHGCKLAKTRCVRQERSETSLREDRVHHRASPEDRILNLAQLRSANDL